MAASNSPYQPRYPPEMRERAVRMVHETIAESGGRQGAVSRVARQLGIRTESLRSWVKQAEIDRGQRPGLSTAEQRRIAELERESRELRRANEILKAASAFFASGSSTRDCRSRELYQRTPHARGIEPICTRSRLPHPRTTPRSGVGRAHDTSWTSD
ncbi:MAG TPA: transposase [Chloroflexota bacterium]|jgi:transposase